MYNNKKRVLILIFMVMFAIALLLIVTNYFNSNETRLEIDKEKITLKYKYSGKETTVNGQKLQIDECVHLFAPSFFDIENIISDSELIIEDGYYYDGAFVEEINNEKQYSKVKRLQANEITIYIHKLENATLCLDLNDNKTINEIKNNKETKFSSNLVNYDALGKTLFNGEVEYIKGRGNSSWHAEKKSYLLSFYSNISLMNIGYTTKYVLIPSHYDMTGLRNKIVYDAANILDLNNTPETSYVNLFVNGNYEGLYLVSNKVSVGEKNDKKIDSKELLSIKDNIGELKEIRYFDNKINSKTESYLIEKDLPYFYQKDTDSAGFITKNGDCYKIHNSKEMTYEEIEKIAVLFQKLEDALESGDDEYFLSSIDMKSWVIRYLLEEMILNHDAGRTSYYYYIDNIEPTKIYAGPVWDYDKSSGMCRMQSKTPDSLMLSNIKDNSIIYELSNNNKFMNEVATYFKENLYPKKEEIIYSIINYNAQQIKSDMYLNAIRYNQQKFILTETDYTVYDYDKAIEELQGILYLHFDYMKQVYEDYFSYHKVVLITKNSLLEDVCYMVKDNNLFINEHEVPYYSNGNGFIWDNYLKIIKWTDKDGNEFDFTKPITEDIELYAEWEGDTNAWFIKK